MIFKHFIYNVRFFSLIFNSLHYKLISYSSKVINLGHLETIPYVRI